MRSPGTELGKGCKTQQEGILEVRRSEKKGQGDCTPFDGWEGGTGNNRHAEGWGTQQLFASGWSTNEGDHCSPHTDIFKELWNLTSKHLQQNDLFAIIPTWICITVPTSKEKTRDTSHTLKYCFQRIKFYCFRKNCIHMFRSVQPSKHVFFYKQM